jgi:taurine dioxygenase
MGITRGAFSIERLTSTIGARVTGIDPREVDEAIASSLLEELGVHGVLVFTARGMTAEEQCAFAQWFGPPMGHPVKEFLLGQADDPISVVENDADKPSQDDQDFHTDYSFNAEIPDLAILRPEILPKNGGDTIWSSTTGAYRLLSEKYRQILVGLNAVHDAGPRFWFEIDRMLGSEQAAKAREAFPAVVHPILTAHPVTGESLLFVNPGYTTAIDGLSALESRSMLQMLFDLLNDSSLHYRHRWHDGDLVMWDEHATVHRGPSDFYPEHRKLTRVTSNRRAPVLAVLV